MKRTLLLCVCLLEAALLWAQTELPEITVTANRIATPTLDSPAFVTVISAAQIAQATSKNLAELLRAQSGVNVDDYGPRGGLKTVSIRGSTAAQVLVLIDGVRQNSARDGVVDLSQIPLSMIDHIEIVRGGESSVYGADAVGGIINIITKKPSGTHLSVGVENGSYLPRYAIRVAEGGTQTPAPASALDLVDTQTAALNGSTGFGSGGLSFGGSFTRAANGYVFHDTQYTGAWRKENHAALLSGSGYIGSDLRVGGGTLSTRGTFLYSDAQVPGPLSGFALTTHAEQENTAASGTINFDTPHLLTNAMSLKISGYYRFDRLGYQDPSQTPPEDSAHTTHSAGVTLTQKLTISDAAALIYGADSEYDFVDSTDIGRLHRTSAGGFAAFPFSPTPLLTLTPSIRYDWYSDFSGGVSYRLGVVYLLGGSSSLKASAGESYRIPTLNDMYWPGPWTPGNPNLGPETAYHADFGYSVRSRSISLDAAVFGRYLIGQIVWGPTGDPIADPWTPQNLGRSVIPGFELHADWALTPAVSLKADYTFMYSLLLADASGPHGVADDLRVPYVPVHSFSSGVSWSRGGTELGIDMEYVGKQYTDTANTEASALQAHVVFNASLKERVAKNLTLSIAGKNIFNELYSTQSGYVMPPFSLWTGIELRM